MTEIGLSMDLADLKALTELKDEPIDYLITVGESTKEEFHHIPFQFNHKLHLSFGNPDQPAHRYESQLDAYRHLRDEIRTELDYFYHRILKEKAAN
jgi:arsenate reductase